MTQRIFDIENEEDMADLWDILPEDINKIESFGIYNRFYNSCSHETHDLIKINWHDATEITRPVDYESMIGCVGWFWDNDDEGKSLGILTGYYPETKFPFVNNANNEYYHFRPAKKSELKFWEDKDE